MSPPDNDQPIRPLLAIVNPTGGRRKGLRVLEQVRPVLADAGIELNVHITRGAGHATELARTLDLTPYGGICAVGGDGTVHEIANGLLQRPEPVVVPLGILPAGTGNTLAQHFDCLNPLTTARRILAGSTRSLDAVQVRLRDGVIHCINIVGWGAVADINRTAERLRMLGSPRYAVAALWHILWATSRSAAVVLDGVATHDQFLFVIACNTRFTGARMKLAPDAETDDGLIDVAIIRRATRWQMLNAFARVYNGSHVSLPYVEIRQVREFSIQSDTDDSLNLDGEMKGQVPLTARVLPGALRVFA